MKTNLMSFVIIALSLLSPDATRAGGLVGNGGDGVVCTDSHGKILSVEILDLYEGRVFRGLNLDLGEASLPFYYKLATIRDRLAKFSQAYADDVYGAMTQVQDNALFLTGMTLVDIPDSNHIAVPNNCTIQQIAVQRDPLIPSDKVFTINRDLWNLLDNNNKAVLILHEVLLRKAVKEYWQTNSITTRYLVSLFTSDEFSRFNAAQFYEALHYAKVARAPLDQIKSGATPDVFAWLCLGYLREREGFEPVYTEYPFERMGTHIVGVLCNTTDWQMPRPQFKNVTIHDYRGEPLEFGLDHVLHGIRTETGSFSTTVSFGMEGRSEPISFDWRVGYGDRNAQYSIFFPEGQDRICFSNAATMDGYLSGEGDDHGQFSLDVPVGRTGCVDSQKKAFLLPERS